MMPRPWRQPMGCPGTALNRASAQATGPGLAASKKRKATKAPNWPSQPTGPISHSISQKAQISSHTMAPGSLTRKCCAVRVQAQQPKGQPTSKMVAQIRSACGRPPKAICSTTKLSQAHSVPTVPGATGLSPLPAPSAMKWAGRLSRMPTVGRRGASLMWPP